MADASDKREWLLAIDTSTEQAGLALTDGSTMSELIWHAGRDQTVSVLAEIDHLLTLAGTDVDQVRAIAIATGPGMFNGLRVGMSVAKGLHLGNGASLIGISTLTTTAEPFGGLAPTVFSVVAAGRGRLVWQPFPGEEPPVNGSVDELADAIGRCEGGALIAGDLDDEQEKQLRSSTQAILPPASLRRRRPGVLAELGWRRLQSGDIDDPITLAPVYVHSSATTVRG